MSNGCSADDTTGIMRRQSIDSDAGNFGQGSSLETADWLPIVAAALLGQLVLVIIEMARGQLERGQRRRDRRDDFQRETLLDLQEVVNLHAMNLAAVLHFERLGHIETKAWRSRRLPDDLNTTDYETRMRINMLSVRVQDDKARRLTCKYTDMTGKAGTALSSGAAEKANEEASNVRHQLNDRIGELLRAL